MRMFAKIFGQTEVTNSLKLLIGIGGLYSLSIALSNSFVNVFLWKQSNRMLDIALYNFAIAAIQPFAFVVAGKVAKKIDRIVVLRLGVIILSLFFMSVLAFGSNGTKNVILFGFLLGMGYGFYWLAFNVLTFEITEPETRDFFNGFLGIMMSLSGMIGPFVSGIVISSFEKFTGYTVIFFVSLVLFVCAVILSFFLNRRSSIGAFTLKTVYRETKVNSNWRNVLFAHFFQGLREGIFAFVVIIFVYIATNSEMAIGTFSLLMSFTQFIMYYLVFRFVSEKFRKTAILLGGIMLYFSIYIILFQLSYFTLLIYAVVISIAYPLLLVPYQSITYDVIGKASKAAERRVEYIVFREVFVNVGRTLSITVFIICVSLFQEAGIRCVMMIFGAGHLILYFFIRNVSFQ